MSTINRSPQGWLGYLGIKNFGRNPPSSGDVLLPTWDLAPMYLNAGAEHGEIPYTAVGGVGANLVLEAGNDVLHVDAFSAYLETGAGESLHVALARVDQSQARSVYLEPSVALTASQQRGIALTREIWLQPGEWLSVNVLEITGAPNWAIQFRFTRCQS